jgi:hypothetical protein
LLDGIQVGVLVFSTCKFWRQVKYQKLFLDKYETKFMLFQPWKLHMFYIPYFQEDFYAIVDWAFKLDPLSCIAMHGITDRYISAQKAEVAGYVPVLLDDLETRITILFGRVCLYL